MAELIWKFTYEESHRTAFHEAGHAWMMFREGLGVVSVSIDPGTCLKGDNRGRTEPEAAMEQGRRELSLKFARAAMAGSAVEHFLLGNWDEEGLQARAHDVGRAKGFVSASGDDWKPEALEHFVQAMANSVLDEVSKPGVWHLVTALAYALMEKGSLTGEEVRNLLGEEKI